MAISTPSQKPIKAVVPATHNIGATDATPEVASVETTEVAASVVEEVAVVAAPVPAPLVLTTTKAPAAEAPAEATTGDALYNRAKTAAQQDGLKTSMLVDRFKASVDRYFKKMAPGQMMSAKDGAFEQYMLVEALIDFFKNENETVHRLMWNYYLHAVTETFGRNFEMLNRFLSDEWTYGKDRYDFLTSVNNLVLWTAVPSTRSSGIKRIDPKYRFKGMFWTEAVQANMARFYNL